MKKQVFDPVTPSSQFNFSQAEKEILKFWKEKKIYKKSLEQRKGSPKFVFYEGPPTANGLPHPGHCLTRTIKDIFPRYKTMDGYYCERKAGWDTHGLPVEIEVAKTLGIFEDGKTGIEKYGVEAFNRACIESVFKYQKEWEEMTERIGFWVDLEQAYVTYHQSYVESVWWALKQLFDKGLLYRGYKVVWWWPQGGTALSAGEVGEGYRDIDDPAVTVRFPLTGESKKRIGLPEDAKASLLIWTTTPWTLLSNCAVCVGPEIEYVLARVEKSEESEWVIVAGGVAKSILGENIKIEKTFNGKELIGLSYEPLFKYDIPKKIEGEGVSDKHWIVIDGDFVDIETGTGLVHIAPAFGEDDYKVCKEKGVGFLCFVKPDGTLDERVKDKDPYSGEPLAGKFCKDADKAIIRILKEKGFLLKHEQFRHAYPFCPRAEDEPLIQYARQSWFIKTSAFIEEFLKNNSNIFWQPEHIKEGRFGNFLENNVDWALSRERFWGTPLPIWVCEKTGYMECISSYNELLSKPGIEGLEVWEKAKKENPNLNEHLKVHKPYIDAITYQSPKDPNARMRRVPEVIDCWFDAGCMPFAQWGYPHLPGSKERFLENFPADFISEAIDQTRGWFYALLSISTMLFAGEKPYPHPFKSCVCLGHIQGEDGYKLSKRLKNYKEPDYIFEKYSADALRWSFVAKNSPTTTTRFQEKLIEELQSDLLIRWYNVYSFFVIYANLDGFTAEGAPLRILQALSPTPEAISEKDVVESEEPVKSYRPWEERSELDRWILYEMNKMIYQVRKYLDEYDIYPAARAISDFLEGLSNWYVRRSRPRFWEGGWSKNKADAYWTLYECLINLARVAAPFVPFFTEITWQNLRKPYPGSAESVHLATYPKVDEGEIDYKLIENMALAREAVTLGLSARRLANIKVRQPLAKCEIVVSLPEVKEKLSSYLDIIKEELNIKEIEFSEEPHLYVDYELKPNYKLLGPKLGNKVKELAKALGTLEGGKIYHELVNKGRIEVDLQGEKISLSEEELSLKLIPKEGFTASQGKNMVVILTTAITEELKKEGWVRDAIREIQEIRKKMQLPYDARIQLELFSPSGKLKGALTEFSDMIAREVLANKIYIYETDSLSDGGEQTSIEGEELRIRVKQV
ncbi:MAG: isoleucine--tRNA ligase [Candidatus Hydrogenedentes bacterium]|nr:isoleucine--tRNA ligase [Candidatus Hydrogenedentota bacterium]